MTIANHSPPGFFSPPSEDGLRLVGMFVLPGDTFRVRWHINGWGWVVAKTTGDLVEKQTHLFFGETDLEFKLQLGQEIDIQVINPFGRVSKRFVAVPNIKAKPNIPSHLTEHMHSTRLVVDASSRAALLRPNSAALDALFKSASQQYVRVPDVSRVSPTLIKNMQPHVDLGAIKAPSTSIKEFNFAKHWEPEWEKLSGLASISDSKKGVSNVNQ
jgi:hypothetical protein